ncbi:hypothetical protein ABK040_014996 [Willaertia magna]
MHQIEKTLKLASSVAPMDDNSSASGSSNARSSNNNTMMMVVNASAIIPSSLVAPKRQRKSTDHKKTIVKDYGMSGAKVSHFKSLSYKPQKRLRKKKKVDPKLVDWLWAQLESAEIHPVSHFQSSMSNSRCCCTVNQFHAPFHSHNCLHNQTNGSSKKKSSRTGSPTTSSSSTRNVRTSISIQELLL